MATNTEMDETYDSKYRSMAEAAAEQLDPKVSTKLLILGQARLAAQQAAASSLDSRFPQVVAFLFGAAAFAMTMVGPSSYGVLAGIAALLLFLGGCVAFSGVRSDFQHLPGIEPSYWRAAVGDARFTETVARKWEAALIEQSIRFNNREAERRGKALNRSLWWGAIGATCVLLAVAGRFLGWT